MFETIVWATDGSDLAEHALPYAQELARMRHARIVAVHANEVLVGRSGGAPLLADEPDVRAGIRERIAELRAEGFDVDLEIVDGHASVAELIAAAARARGADLIVVGTHGESGFKAALLGGVTRRLLQIARCPVLAVPPARSESPKPRESELVGSV